MWRYMSVCVPLTTTITFLLITSIHTVSISITAPADGDAMAIFALELITVTFHITAVLDKNILIFIRTPGTVCQISKHNVNQEGNIISYLIWAISTIMVSIALPAPSNAAAIGAGKLTLWTLTGYWEQTEQGLAKWQKVIKKEQRVEARRAVRKRKEKNTGYSVWSQTYMNKIRFIIHITRLTHWAQGWGWYNILYCM